MPEERRCPSCGALAAADAEWCGQCFASLRTPEPEPAPAREPAPEPAPEPATAAGASVGETTDAGAAGATAGEAPRRAPYWPCGVCGAENPIEAEVCGTCGTPFAQMMREERARPSVDPETAFRRSLLFPGLGHRAVGRGMDGLARGVLFAIALVMAILLGLTATGPVTTLVFLAFAATAVGVYVASAIEARNLARGGGLLVSSRTLMWILVGLVFVSVGLLGFAVVTSLRK